MSEDAVTTSWGHGPCGWSILVHGGAGDVAEDRIPKHITGCERAAAAGAAVLAAGGSALDAVQRAVEVLEDDPLFNAGTGACLNEDAAIELDASIMDGSTLRAGAVCALPTFKNPIAIARRVMQETRHVLLAAEGAARFALAHGFERADPASMITDLARSKLETAREKHRAETWAGGTVGAVARDASGHVAAATSTGGMVNKLVGRVGDSPILGAGTYADDATAACSTTGHGEAMMRVCLAKTASDAARTTSAEAAARASLAMMAARTEGTGGAIIARSDGSLGLARTTRTMSWAAEMNDGTRASGA
ncbi:MAG TPA: isoaspartyl peptidase/L-asparaginase [Labilithrix sp.]|nr:isoaspartyl peptidase/L-asparaginase [Labilithrix sp.]